MRQRRLPSRGLFQAAKCGARGAMGAAPLGRPCATTSHGRAQGEYQLMLHGGKVGSVGHGAFYNSWHTLTHCEHRLPTRSSTIRCLRASGPNCRATIDGR
eukprot:UN3164